MQFANCATIGAVLFTTLNANICSYIENLKLCSSAEAEIALNFFFNFELKWASCSCKIVLIKNKKRNYKLNYIFIDSFPTSGPVCIGCGGSIHDQYILRVAPNLEWHAHCLKCSECGKTLDENCTCFVKRGKTYCKKDYTR